MLAWAGVTDEELNELQAPLKLRAELWSDEGWGLISESVRCLSSSVAPTHLSGLKEPSPEWLSRLEQLECFAELLVTYKGGEGASP